MVFQVLEEEAAAFGTPWMGSRCWSPLSLATMLVASWSLVPMVACINSHRALCSSRGSWPPGGLLILGVGPAGSVAAGRWVSGDSLSASGDSMCCRVVHPVRSLHGLALAGQPLRWRSSLELR